MRQATSINGAKFLHLPGEKFYDFNKIRGEIVQDAEAKTGVRPSHQENLIHFFSKGISPQLPGLTKVPVSDY